MPELFNPGYYTEDDLHGAGFRSLGHNVRMARNCMIIGIENIEIGSNVRIDGHSTLATAGGHIRIGNYVHIGGCCFLSGGAGITLEDNAGLSHGVRLDSKTDDYSGASMTNPTVPAEFTNCKSGAVHLGMHVIIGSNSVVMPGHSLAKAPPWARSAWSPSHWLRGVSMRVHRRSGSKAATRFVNQGRAAARAGHGKNQLRISLSPCCPKQRNAIGVFEAG